MYVKYLSPTSVEVFEGRVLRDENRVYVNPTPETLAEHGYLPLAEGFKATCEEDENATVVYRYRVKDGEVIKDEVIEYVV